MTFQRYPPTRYHGEHGQASARHVPADAAPDLVSPRAQVRFLAGAPTGDDLGVYRWTMPPRTGGASPHFHRTITEAFCVLRGRVTIYDGTTWRPCGVGDYVHVPPGGVHGFRNDFDDETEFLILFSPAAPREAYFEALVAAANEGRALGEDELRGLWAGHDQVPVDEA